VMKSVVVLAVLALGLVACSGGSGGESDSTSSTEAKIDAGTEPPPAADTSTTQPEASDEPVASGDEGTGTATIGDTTWEFALSGAPGEFCDPDANDAGLIFVVLMFGTDDTGREIALSFGAPLSGGDVAVQAGSPTLQFERWTADQKVYDRLSGIEGMPEGVGATAQVDGNTVSGSGVFYDDTNLTEVRPTGGPYDAGVLEGTFSATCPAG